MIEKDVLVVGAGLLGSSVAMHLSALSDFSVGVVDLDLEGTFSSSELNAGGVRATWNHPVNAEISQTSIDYFQTVKEEVGFRQNGYFWMYSKEDWEKASSNLKKNPKLEKMNIEYLTPAEVTRRYSFIDKTEDLGGATFSPYDGLLNPNLLKLHYRKKAKDKGVEFLDRIWVHHVEFPDAKTIILDAYKWPNDMSEEDRRKVFEEGEHPAGSEEIKIKTKMLVNCSGAWARRFADFMNVECVGQPLRRQVSIFDCKDVDLTPYGMFVDTSGVYFHAEANNILGGYASPEEIPGYNFEYDGEKFFQEHIWPALYERSSKFENLKHMTGWAGLYEISPDNSAIVGKVSGFKNVYEAHSFSGRGAMQSYGAGLGLAELIATGSYQTHDLGGLNGNRFKEGKLISEKLLI